MEITEKRTEPKAWGVFRYFGDYPVEWRRTREAAVEICKQLQKIDGDHVYSVRAL